MSNKDYTKYAKMADNVVEPIPEMVSEPIPEMVIEQPAVEVTPEPVFETEPEPVVEPEVVIEPRKIGRVYNCAKLNVRAAAKFNSDVICEIPCNTEVEINEDDSTGDYYKICTSSGIEGFCMKTYISVE